MTDKPKRAGRKPLRGVVKVRTNLALTEDALTKLDKLFQDLGLPSRSELVQAIAEGEYILIHKSEADSMGKPVNVVSNTSG